MEHSKKAEMMMDLNETENGKDHERNGKRIQKIIE